MRNLESNRDRPAMDAPRFRPARADETSLLGELALRSKGSWGYDEDFLKACTAELTFRPADIAARRIVVAERASEVVGFYSIDGEPPSGELGNMWVVPEQIGTGLGRELWQHALANACRAGFTSLCIAADPHAAGFYRAMGAEQIGEVPSGSVAGRSLPLLLVNLPAGA